MVFVEAPLPPPSLSYEDGGNGDSNHTITMVVADVHAEPPLSGWWLARILLRWRRKIEELPRHVIYVIGAAAIVGTGYIIYLLVKRRRRPRDARPPLPGNGGQPPPGGDHPQAPKLKHLPDDRAASGGDDAEYDEDQGPGDGDETGGEGSAAYGLHDIAAFAVAFSNSPTGPTLLLNPEKSHFSIPWFERLTIFDVCPRPNLVESTSGSRDLQMVRPGLGVLTRPLPTKYRSLGDNFCERVLTSLMHETLKAVVAQYNASQLIIPREVDEQEAQRAKFIVEKAEQHKRKAVITEQGEAKSALVEPATRRRRARDL
nr:uncharacterized protein LOC112938361 [Oryza sativa Japonica Group]